MLVFSTKVTCYLNQNYKPAPSPPPLQPLEGHILINILNVNWNYMCTSRGEYTSRCDICKLHIKPNCVEIKHITEHTVLSWYWEILYVFIQKTRSYTQMKMNSTWYNCNLHCYRTWSCRFSFVWKNLLPTRYIQVYDPAHFSAVEIRCISQWF